MRKSQTYTGAARSPIVEGLGYTNGETAAPLNGKLKHLKDVSVALLAAVESLEETPSCDCDVRSDMNHGLTFYERVKLFEINLIKRALKQSEGNQTKAAALLGINHTTLHAMIKRHQIKVRYSCSSHD